MSDYPDRVVVGANGAYWRDYGTHYSMCPVSEDNDPVQVAAVYVRVENPPTATGAVGRLGPEWRQAMDYERGFDDGKRAALDPEPRSHVFCGYSAAEHLTQQPNGSTQWHCPAATPALDVELRDRVQAALEHEFSGATSVQRLATYARLRDAIDAIFGVGPGGVNRA